MLKAKTLVILTVLALLFAGLFTMAAAEYREDFSKTLPLKAGDDFSLGIVTGQVTVSTWKDNKVEIKAVKVARDNEKDLKDVEIRVDESAGIVSVKAIWPRHRDNFHVRVDFDVKVPEGVNLRTIETVNGDVDVTGLFGSAELETTNGSITLAIEAPDQINASLLAETTNGHISVDFPVTLKNLRQSRRLIEAQIGQGGPEISLHTTNGSITLTK